MTHPANYPSYANSFGLPWNCRMMPGAILDHFRLPYYHMQYRFEFRCTVPRQTTTASIYELKSKISYAALVLLVGLVAAGGLNHVNHCAWGFESFFGRNFFFTIDFFVVYSHVLDRLFQSYSLYNSCAKFPDFNWMISSWVNLSWSSRQSYFSTAHCY